MVSEIQTLCCRTISLDIANLRGDMRLLMVENCQTRRPGRRKGIDAVAIKSNMVASSMAAGVLEKRMTQSDDPEIAAMSAVLAALSPLDEGARFRVLDWVASKLGLQPTSPRAERKSEFGNEAERLPTREGTVSTVSARLGVKSCRELFKAAAYHISRYQGKERFSRSEWMACAKDAKHWKAEYSAQMATTISRLHNNGFVNETSKDVFSVPDDELRALDAQMGA